MIPLYWAPQLQEASQPRSLAPVVHDTRNHSRKARKMTSQNTAARIAPEAMAAPPPRITLDELERRIKDPAVTKEELAPYFKATPNQSGAFNPAFAPNPDRVETPEDRVTPQGAIAVSWLNGLIRWRRREEFEDRLSAGDRRPVIVSEGDSWFLFPVELKDVTDHLLRHYNILSLAAAGDTLADMAQDQDYLSGLQEQRTRVRAFMLSAGGNDVIGEDENGEPVITRIVRPFKSGLEAKDYIDHDAFRHQIKKIGGRYADILKRASTAFPRLPLVCHGYDFPIPAQPNDPRSPWWAAKDEWLGSPMRDGLNIKDARLQQEIVKLMIDAFYDTLKSLCGANHAGGQFNTAWLVDNRNIVRGRWADEIHPTSAGFLSVAENFKSVVDQALG